MQNVRLKTVTCLFVELKVKPNDKFFNLPFHSPFFQPPESNAATRSIGSPGVASTTSPLPRPGCRPDTGRQAQGPMGKDRER